MDLFWIVTILLLFWNFGFESLNRQLHVPTFVSVFYVVFFLIFVMIKCKVYESLQKERKMIFKILKPVNGVAIFLNTLFKWHLMDQSLFEPVNGWPDFVTGWPRWTRAE